MAGIYIHIPFCKQKCHYCNFYSVASSKFRDSFVNALITEISERASYLSNEPINTIYFGGGTPSMLSASEINKINVALDHNFNINPKVEITLEANPDDLADDKLKSLKNETSINRLSIGIQSFFDDDLIYLNRVHNGIRQKNRLNCHLKLDFKT